MSAQNTNYSSNITLEYNADKRLKEIIAGLKHDLKLETVEINCWSNLDSIVTANGKDSDVLTAIENQIKELSQEIETIKVDGNENRFLIFEDRCRKLLTKLDAIPVDNETDRQRRKKDVENIKMYSTQLKKSSIDNLKKLLASVEQMDRSGVNGKVFRETRDFIQKSNSSTITEVDNYRDNLEDIRHKLQSKTNYRD